MKVLKTSNLVTLTCQDKFYRKYLKNPYCDFFCLTSPQVMKNWIVLSLSGLLFYTTSIKYTSRKKNKNNSSQVAVPMQTVANRWLIRHQKCTKPSQRIRYLHSSHCLFLRNGLRQGGHFPYKQFPYFPNIFPTFFNTWVLDGEYIYASCSKPY